MTTSPEVDGRAPDPGNSAVPYTILKETTATNIPWYQETVGPRLDAPMRQLFENYSRLPSADVVPHIEAIRGRAWTTRPYPCVGSYGFLSVPLRNSPLFPMLVSRLKSGDTLVDLGTCFGQDLRALVVAGAPSSNMFAVDLLSDFWELSYDLFRDRHSMQATFIKADFMAEEYEYEHEQDALEHKPSLKSLEGKVDIIHAGYFFHLFGWDAQIEALVHVVKLSRPGAILVGHQIGRAHAEAVATSWGDGQTVFHHNAESWRKIWVEVQKRTDTKWKVDCDSIDLGEFGLQREDYSWMAATAKALTFAVQRL